MCYAVSESGIRCDSKPMTALVLASGTTFIAFLDVTVMNVAFPALHASFPATPVAELSWSVSGYGVLFAALLIPAGRLADAVGRKRLFVSGMAGFGVASALSAGAPAVAVLIAARALQGIFAAAMMPASMGLALAAVPRSRRGLAASAWAGSGALAAAVGPALGGVIIDAASWRLVFAINVPLCLAVAVAAQRELPADTEYRGRRPDLLGAVLLAAGAGLWIVALTKAASWGWLSGASAGTVLGSVLLVAAGIARSRRHRVSAPTPDPWCSLPIAMANVTSILGGAGLYALLLAGPLFLTAIWRYSLPRAGLAMSPGALTSAVASVLAGRAVRSQRYRVIVIACGTLLLAACAGWLAAQAGAAPRFLALWLPAGVLVGLATGSVLTALSGLVATATDPAELAAGIGLNTAAGQLGGAMGVAALAAIGSVQGLRAPAGFRTVFLFCAAAALAASLPAIILFVRRAPALAT